MHFALTLLVTLGADGGAASNDSSPGARATPAVAAAKPAVTPSIFAGVWELDLKASSDLKPLMDLLDVGGLTRLMAPGVVTTQTITATAEKLDITVKSTFKKKELTVVFNQPVDTTDEVFDNVIKVQSKFVDGRAVSEGTLTYKGTTIPVAMRRFIEEGRMVLETTFSPADKAQVVTRRVFNRKK